MNIYFLLLFMFYNIFAIQPLIYDYVLYIQNILLHCVLSSCKKKKKKPSQRYVFLEM